ncbi:MAG: carboxypeptidase-like regulatory domain-containing protein [Bacteroides sp.]|nr:carboxypeptidase-like regulatory domain-containing protein [Bacteroides sp.]
MYKYLFILYRGGLSWVENLAAQECGKVLDIQTGEPVTGAHIYLQGTELVAITNQDGVFCLPVSFHLSDTDLLSFSHIGYEKRMVTW